MITVLETITVNDPISALPLYRAVKISIQNGQIIYLWHVGGLPLEGDLQPILDARFDELWTAASKRAIPVPSIEVFNVPILAPDFMIATPKIKDDPLEALQEAKNEAKKGEGQNKSMGLMVLSMMRHYESLLADVETLKADMENLKKGKTIK